MFLYPPYCFVTWEGYKLAKRIQNMKVSAVKIQAKPHNSAIEEKYTLAVLESKCIIIAVHVDSFMYILKQQ